jgi:hypothetical protein
VKQDILRAFQEKQKKQEEKPVVVPVVDARDTEAAKEDDQGPDGSQRATEAKKSAK